MIKRALLLSFTLGALLLVLSPAEAEAGQLKPCPVSASAPSFGALAQQQVPCEPQPCPMGY